MKKFLKKSFILLALLGVMFTSCKKDYPEPPIQVLPIGTVYSIDDILNMESGTVFTDDASVYGIVTADEQSGNLYKAAFIQDRASGKAIELYLNATSGVRIGDSIRVYLKDVTYSEYNGLPQLSNFEADGHIVILANLSQEKQIQPKEVTIAEIVSGKGVGPGELVKLKNVMFTERNTFAEPNTYGNRTLVDPTDFSHSVIVRTSNYANFAKDSLPQGTGNMVCIASIYGSTWQLLIRSAKELEFDGYTPGPGGGSSLPYYQDFASSFGTYSTYDVSGSQSWEIDYSTAKMTGYVGGNNYANEDWLISAPVSFAGVSEVSMTMKYIARYFSNLNNDITIQVSTDYVTGDPNQAKWTKMDASLSEGSNWTDFFSANVDLSQFAGQEKVVVAVKYLSDDVKAGTIEIQSILLQEGGGVNPPPGPNPGGEVQSIPYTQSFATEFGSYMTYDVLGAQSWIIDYSTAKMTGHTGGNPGENYDNEDWLISSPVDLSSVSAAKMTMSYIGRYFTNINEEVTVWASTNYTWGSDPTTATWTQVPATLREGTNWNDFLTAEIDLVNASGQQLAGQTVTFAVKYTSTNQKAGTMEIQSITIEESGGVGPTPPPGPGGEVQNMPYTQSFATSFGTYITKDVLGAQSWAIDYSTAKMTGHIGGNPGEDYANEDWLISSPVAITGVNAAKMTMVYIGRYFTNINNEITIWVSTNYTWNSSPGTATWTQVPATLREGTNWNDFLTAEIDLSQFVGQTVYVAVKYTSTGDNAGTIEIQSITIEEGGGVGPTPPPGPGGEVQSMPYSQSFTTEFGSYTTYDVLGPESWVIDYSTAKMTGFVNQNESHANEDWLISSPVAITGVDAAKMTMVYIGRYFNNINEDITIWASTDYTWNNAPASANWTQVSATLKESSSWQDFVTTEIALTDYVGQVVTFAVKYVSRNSRDSYAGTIEVQSITIEEGSVGPGPGPTPPPGPGTGSGTQDDPYNVVSGINLQGQNVTAWVQGYIVGSVKDGFNAVNSNDQINWSAPFDLKTNVVIADDPTCHEISNCIIVNLPANKPLRTQVNLVDHPENLGLQLAVLGTLKTYFGQAGLRDSNGTENDFVLYGGTPPTPPPTGEVQPLPYIQSFASGFGTYTTYDVLGPQSWGIDYSTARMTGYVNNNGQDEYYANEDWLISSPFEVPTGSMVLLSMTVEYLGRYFDDINSDVTFWVTSGYEFGTDPTSINWIQLPCTLTQSDNWNDFHTATIDLSIIGQLMSETATIAVKYTSSEILAGTIEIKKITIE